MYNLYVWDHSAFVVAETPEQARALVQERVSVASLQKKVVDTEPEVLACPGVYVVYRPGSTQ